jgi:hypothetical protein
MAVTPAALAAAATPCNVWSRCFQYLDESRAALDQGLRRDRARVHADSTSPTCQRSATFGFREDQIEPDRVLQGYCERHHVLADAGRIRAVAHEANVGMGKNFRTRTKRRPL